MRPVVPDVSLWSRLTELFSLLGAAQAVGLLACAAGVVLSCLAWAGGRSLGLGGVSRRGLAGVVVSLAAAFLVVALPGLVGWVVGVFA